MIYFIHCPKNRMIKIGLAFDPVRRLDSLQTGSPHPLLLIGSIPGESKEERMFHNRFAKHRVRGEWFRSDILDEVKILVSGSTQKTDDAKDITYRSNYEKASKEELEQVFRLINQKLLPSIGFRCIVSQVIEFRKPKNRFTFQIMPEREWSDFWGWHLDNSPQYHKTPGDAADAFLEAFHVWRDTVESAVPA